MFLEKTISIKKDKGVVALEIKARNATSGNFNVAVDAPSGFQVIGKGKFGDSIPDIYVIPYLVQELGNHGLAIIGNFCAGNPLDDDTISFDLNFIQMGEVSDCIELREKNKGVVTLTYSIDFKLI